LNVAAARVEEFHFASLANIEEGDFLEAPLPFLLSLYL
jgi:hypothetical protein